MRTLKEIDEAVAKASRERVEQILKTSPIKIMTPQEIMTAQCEARFGEIYREMHSILTDVEKLLKGMLEGDDETQELLKRIAAL